MKRVVLGVTGSIAAFKAASIASGLKKRGVEVHVVMTESSTHFITPLTMQILSEQPVHLDVMAEPIAGRINHIDLAQQADLVLIAPATANIIGKLANGIGDEMLSTICLAVPQEVPKLIAPAMNTKMYLQPVVQENLAKIAGYGYAEIKPVSQMLACGDVGIGALAPVEEIVEEVMVRLA
ncbi:phosphopantothenoylcysteine decarboxylase [Vagococcus sp. BWB3-3]|uniref:Phosphopantothenoylcysteine decarboxylase n=1 Tax=Vagococcus allomyrinae TaxID=2794353 RepID=A0A940PAU8_9ENTE|nr:flavoprotein [Vagococcus allomyrinae]MBP1044210.1 phosphopantothenoylcysteine decarboxylase [Vagococcus allomyrinae]